ncbi:flagellar motor protein MotB [Crateriforma conspicua]|uniref:Motility protein B n=1 Tax=Crateriforma conspicua TaxID=2527996 RepID=A0A5C6FW36_9PLAN|nr:OmpA family protein [Crateriforma conspicua]TWU65253.1 Motility protein B [Crateriforma conspicua]
MNEEPEEMGIPEWVVTFGDMMSLLLTFFIMLVSLSEIKEEETYQALVDSMQRSFGYQRTIEALTPGESKPRESNFSVLSTVGRAKNKNTAKGGVPQKAPTGEDPHVRIVRPGQMTAVGSVIFFPMGSDELDKTAKRILKEAAAQLRGKPQKIEVRGHTSSEFAARTRGTGKAMELGFNRANAVRRYLIEQEGIEAERFRIATAGGTEPMHNSAGNAATSRNPRVEVFLLDETVDDLHGTEEERRSGRNEYSTSNSESI